uniref:Uncharacterized protein TCIL3000_11_7760 n=1 Tax=Trypanosoma congolense (strain IL3000) TaxID=1068625 RepID=G0V116_TRYCI|nr:unnamed protein product [Trypanosoma congolense IL3000]
MILFLLSCRHVFSRSRCAEAANQALRVCTRWRPGGTRQSHLNRSVACGSFVTSGQMVKRDLEKERQVELAAIWGAETDGENRFPRRRRLGTKRSLATSSLLADASAEDVGGVPSDIESDAASDRSGRDKRSGSKSGKRKKTTSTYRLHCFVAPGTERNDVRAVFEAYEPKVELRTSQQGNLLNKTHFAVLTFRNKAMALHAVKMLDGTDQYDRIGVRKLKLGLMLSRKENAKARQKLRKRIREERELQMSKEAEEEAAFIQRFINTYAPPKRATKQ